jgi:hypothetical protein
MHKHETEEGGVVTHKHTPRYTQCWLADWLAADMPDMLTCLLVKALLVADDFECLDCASLVVKNAQHLAKTALAQNRLHLISVCDVVAHRDKVVAPLIIVATVVLVQVRVAAYLGYVSLAEEPHLQNHMDSVGGGPTGGHEQVCAHPRPPSTASPIPTVCVACTHASAWQQFDNAPGHTAGSRSAQTV